jgi:predicted phage terminase large subunit-like protein
MALLNTPQDFQDLSEDAKKDKQFVSASFGCWTKETEGLAIEEQESSWPARYPSAELRAEKEAAIARNKYSIFAREKECLLIVPEECAFRKDWLNFFGVGEPKPEPPRHEMWIEIAIDPVPPPSKTQLEQGFKKKDYEAFSVVGRWRGDYYLLESVYNRGHQPNWTVNTFFELCQRWNPRKVIVEAVAYQATLAWLLRQGMQKTGRYWAIEEFKDKRQKYKRIVDGLSAVASEGHFFIRRSQTTFISQFEHYPGKNPNGQFDDVLESVAVATGSLTRGFVGDVPDDHYKNEEAEYEQLEYLGAP